MKFTLLLLASLAVFGQNPNTASFPTAVATDNTLGVAKRLSQSSLTGSATSGATSITVADGTQFLTGEVIRIDSEELQVTGIASNTLTVTRAFNGTTSASHASGSTVSGIISSYYHDQMAAEMKVLEAYLRDYLNGCQDAGSNDTYTCNLAPPIASYVTGGLYKFKANTANTGAATVNFNGVGAKTIKKHSSSGLVDLSDNDIFTGDWVLVMYNGTVMQLMGTVGSGGGTWGTITGTLSSQTDLQSALNAKLSGVAWGIITGTLSSQTDLQAALDAKLMISTEQAGTPKYCRSTTGNNTYVCSVTPTLTGYTRGGCLVLDGDTANTGTATVNVNSLGAKSILNHAGSALSNSDIVANKPITICYDGTQFIIQGDGSTAGSGGNFSEYTVSGLPSATGIDGTTVVVTDALTGTDCTVGGGSIKALCISTGVAWLATLEFNKTVSGGGLINVSSAAGRNFSINSTDVPWYCTTTTSSATTYGCQVQNQNGAYSAYANGAMLYWDVGSTACTGSTATTLNVDVYGGGSPVGAKRVYRQNGTSDPLSSDCVADTNLLLIYDTSLTSGAGGWRMLAGNPASISVGTGLSSSTNPTTGEQTVAVDGTGQTLAGDQAGQAKKCSSTTGSMTYTCTMTPTLATYSTNMVVEFVCATTALTGAATLNIDGLGAKSIKKSDGSTNPATGDCAAGQQVPLRYDGTVFRLPAAGSSVTPATLKIPHYPIGGQLPYSDATSTVVSSSANKTAFVAFTVPYSMSISKLYMYLSAASGTCGGTCGAKFAIYDSTTSSPYTPNAILAQTATLTSGGAIDINGSAGVIAPALGSTITLSPGVLYWYGATSDSTSFAIYRILYLNGITPTISTSALGTGSIGYGSNGSGSGSSVALPSSGGTITYDGTLTFVFGLGN